MHRLFTAGAACALWFFAGPVAAEPFQNFMNLCMDTNADAVTAGAEAKALGWALTPMEPSENDLNDAVVYLNVDMTTAKPDTMPANVEILLTGWANEGGDFALSGVRIDACSVVALEGDHAALRERLGDLLRIPTTNLNGEDVWVFSRQGGGFRSEAALMELELEEFPRIARERKIYVAGTIGEDGMAGLILGALRPVQ